MLRNVLAIVVFLCAATVYGSPLDSIGIKQKGGKNFIIHKVEPKETLYSLSRKYGVTVDEIKAANDNSTELKIGETVLIPYKKSIPVEKNTGTKIGKKSIHKVQAKETYYSISKKYGVSVDELKKANPGVGDLKVGQEIVIPGSGKTASDTKQSNTKKKDLPDTHKVEAKETFFSISKKYDITVEELKKANPGVTELKTGQVISISGKKVETNTDATNLEGTDNIGDNDVNYTRPTGNNKNTDPKKKDYVEVKEPKIITGPENNTPTFSSIKKDGYTKVNETGIAEVYNDNSGFHYALHKTAPVGTIIYLVNETNGQKVYVRVMGKLTDASPGIILRISPKALEKLSKGESKVKVSATYIP